MWNFALKIDLQDDKTTNKLKLKLSVFQDTYFCLFYFLIK